MKTYILRRLLLMIPTLFGITMVVYFIVRLAPGDPVEAMIRNQAGNLDPKVMKADTEKIRQRLGLVDYHFLRDRFYGAPASPQDEPKTFAYKAVLAGDNLASAAIGYVGWMKKVAHRDFGESIQYRGRPALDLIIERIPVTVTLNVFADTLIFGLAIPIGLAAARRQGRWFDVTSSLTVLVLYSVPPILAGTLLLGYLGLGGQGLEWFPLVGLHSFGYEKLSFYDHAWGLILHPSWPAACALYDYLKDLLWHVALPVVCLVYGGLAYMAKMGRASLLENLRADYVRTARAKGLPEGRVIYHHALRNSLLPMITIMVLTVPALLGGSVVVESIFSIQGTGLLLVGAAQTYDLAVLMAETLLYGVLTLGFLLIGDVLYAWADPRVRYE